MARAYRITLQRETITREEVCIELLADNGEEACSAAKALVNPAATNPTNRVIDRVRWLPIRRARHSAPAVVLAAEIGNRTD